MCFAGPSEMHAHILVEMYCCREFWTQFENGHVLTTNNEENMGESEPELGHYFLSYDELSMPNLLKKHRAGIDKFRLHKQTEPIVHETTMNCFGQHFTNQIDSWQELYDKLVDKYGPQAAEWKDAALHSLENQVSRLDKTQNEHWMEFESYHEVEVYLESLGGKVAEPEIRDWVTQGKSWISVSRGPYLPGPAPGGFPFREIINPLRSLTRNIERRIWVSERIAPKNW